MNKYEIVGIVGEGAYGIVYKAKNKENGEFGKYQILSILKDKHIFSSCPYSFYTFYTFYSLSLQFDNKPNNNI